PPQLYPLSLHDALPISLASGIARANRSPFRFPKSIIALDLIQKQILFDLNQAIVPLPLPNALAFGVKHRKSDPPLVLHHAKDASSFHAFFNVFLATFHSGGRAIEKRWENLTSDLNSRSDLLRRVRLHKKHQLRRCRR